MKSNVIEDEKWDLILQPKRRILDIPIQEIIESDTEKKTDARISQILKERGIDIAVRTVNKYRKEIGLPSSYHRN